MKQRLIYCLSLAACLLLLAGCGAPKPVKVHGKLEPVNTPYKDEQS